MGDNQKVVWAEFLTLSWTVLLHNKVNEWHASSHLLLAKVCPCTYENKVNPL
jgi:hypothetical protein